MNKESGAPDSRAGARLLHLPITKKAPPLVRDEAEVRGTTLIPAQNAQALGIRNVYERHDLPAVFIGRFLPCCFSGKFKRLSELKGAYSR